MSARTHLPSGLVTFLFTDIEGSTRLAQMLGRGYRPVLNEHRQLLRAHAVRLRTASSCSPRVTPSSSRSPTPPARSRPASRPSAPSPPTSGRPRRPTPRVRMGLHTGYAEPLGGEYASPEVHRAARVAAAAHGGQVLCSAATARHAVGDLPDDACLLDLGPAPAARLRRPGAALPAGRARPGAAVPAPAHRRRARRTTCPTQATALHRARRPSGPSSRELISRTGW